MLLIRLFLTVKFSASRWAALATVDSLSLVIQQKMTRGLVLLENGITFPFSPLPKEGESSLLPSHCVGSVFPIIGGQNGRRLDPPHTHTTLVGRGSNWEIISTRKIQPSLPSPTTRRYELVEERRPLPCYPLDRVVSVM